VLSEIPNENILVSDIFYVETKKRWPLLIAESKWLRRLDRPVQHNYTQKRYWRFNVWLPQQDVRSYYYKLFICISKWSLKNHGIMLMQRLTYREAWRDISTRLTI